MSDNRKEFEAAVAEAYGDIGIFIRPYQEGLFDGWRLGRTLSAPQPAPVAAEPQFHNVMRLLQAAQMEHGLCEPRSRRACTHCNAKDDLDALLKCYKGPPIRTATISPAQEGAAAEPIGWLFGSEGDGFKRGAQRPDERLSWQPVYTSPIPAQQGDVADEARFEELLDALVAGVCRYFTTMPPYNYEREREAIHAFFKQSRADKGDGGLGYLVTKAIGAIETPNEAKGRVMSEMFWRGVYALQSALSTQAGSEA